MTGLPSLQQLERLVDSAASGKAALSSRLTLLVVDIVHLKDVNVRYGRAVGDEALRHVVKYARGSLRVADILFRCADDEFVALLNDADLETANAIASRIRENISVNPFDAGDETIPLSVRVIALSAAGEGVIPGFTLPLPASTSPSRSSRSTRPRASRVGDGDDGPREPLDAA